MSHIDRPEAIQRLKVALRERTGRTWSVSGNRGTAWGWIDVRAPKARQVGEFGYLDEADQLALGDIFKLMGGKAHYQGHSIAPDSRSWAVAAAEGRIRPSSDGNGWEEVPEAPQQPVVDNDNTPSQSAPSPREDTNVATKKRNQRVQYQVRFSEEELETITEAAEASDLPVSTYIRITALKAAKALERKSAA